MANNTLLASDSFASGSLAAGWAAAHGLTGVCQVVSGSPNVTEPAALTNTYGQIWTGLTWPNDHASELTSLALSSESTTQLQLFVRYQLATQSGYVMALNNGGAGTLAIFKATAGSFVRLGSLISGLTFAANDIWTFQAAGACLSVYQNFKLVYYIYDATYTSGYPGFAQQSSTNITHTKVGSWRGYNAVQQDGIWQKQGIVIPANATDLTPDGSLVFGAFQISKILFNGTKYTALFASGVGTTGAGGNGNIYYADSPDGKAPWTRSGSPVIANYTNPSLWFDGTTYHCYCQSISAVIGNVAHFTSPDMTSTSTWTLDSANVLSPGSGWETSIFLLAPVAIVVGTWYALYNGLQGGLWKIGLATSPDGHTWTKDPTNPKLAAANGSGVVVSQAVAKVGSSYYAWFYGNQPGQGNASAPLQDPFDAVRYKTSDLFQTWTLDSHSQRHSQLFESANAIDGGIAPCAIIDIGGKAYMYGLSCPGDAIGPQIYQTSLTIGPAPIASIVTAKEDGLQQVAADAFTSGAGDLSANWTLPTGGTKLQIVSGPYVEPTTTSTVCQAVYTGATFTANQYSKIILQTLTGTLAQSLVWPTVRNSLVALSDYEGRIASPTGTSDAAAAIYKRVAGVATQIGPTAAIKPSVGDSFAISVIDGGDGFPVLSLFQNDFFILQVQDQSATPLTTGNPGIQAESVLAIADAQIASWAGGNANVIPNYTSVLFPPFFGR